MTGMLGSRGSLRRRVTVLMVLAGVVVAVMAAGALISFSSLSTARQRLADRYDPALVASAELLAARGRPGDRHPRLTSLSGQRSFLEPYTSVQDRERAITAEFSDLLLVGDLLATRARRSTTASAAWREQAGEPAERAVEPGSGHRGSTRP